MGEKFRASALLKSERFYELGRMKAYFDCTQHDWQKYDFDGRIRRKGPEAQQPLLTQEQAGFYVPLRQRRPCAPVRLGKAIVSAFTNLLFGEERWPRFLCPGDADTQDYAEALAKEEELRVQMVAARNLGGSQGAVGLSWSFDRGKPRVKYHSVQHLYVHEWEDREKLVPSHVSEFFVFHEDEYDEQKARMVRNWYWHRCDWTPDETVGFARQPFKPGYEPEWVPDPEASVQHGFGFAPFVWIQNQPSQDPEGVPDYHGQYDAMDTLDVTSSVVSRGTILNCDPTVVLKMNAAVVARTGIKKGSDNAIAVGESGDAHYMELAGSGLDAGLKVKADQRAQILEACECVIPNPDQVAAAGTSSVAIKAIYAPMLGKSAIHRELYGGGIRRLIEQQLKVARERHGRTVMVQNPGDPENGIPPFEEEVVETVVLPPKVVEVPPPPPPPPEIDPATGVPVPTDPEEEQALTIPIVEEVERVPGKAERVELGWGEWFPMTPQDKNQAVQAVQTASGGKAVLSQQTATEEAARIFDRNPVEEWQRVRKVTAEDQAREAQMFKQAGGAVDPDAEPELDEEGNPVPKPPGGPPGLGKPKPKGKFPFG